ncbi:putative glucuronoxylan glucuronosyltransferase F8H [Acorus gramineus]|uniref:Glucuronoxylan glucuronosyltransferase F8H n=1 Tax=Acorus gramineus TaxID=55184 RepID=A0AAV9AAP5_ACOGR|nr:putative glucuronoxylan glucuronosyltransferase F8H [Acorus gramineus]
MSLQRPTKNSNKEHLYIKMKLLQNRPSRTNFADKTLLSSKNLRYLLLLWLSLSLYLLFTSLFSPSNPPLKPTLHSSATASRALIEATTAFASPPLRIYVYDLPPTFNADWLSNPRCATHLFGSEVAIHRALLRSPVRTTDPSLADFFFVPVYVACNFSTSNGFPSLGHARRSLSSAVHRISSEMPFWNRTRGSDHVFVASHDYGACFHAMEDVAVAEGVPEFLRRSVMLQTFGVNRRHPCQDVEHVLIPPYVVPETVRPLSEFSPARRRDIFAFFRGKMEVHPKNISGRVYSRGVRTEILKRYGNDRRFRLKRQRYDGYQSEIERSTFCLCPLGWAPWSPRLVESVALGCVPVIIADDIRLPFPETVRWPEISLSLRESDVRSLARVLERVAATNLSAIQRNLWDPAVRRALLFNDEVRYGDATWHVLEALHRKLRRRRSTTDTWR